MSQNVKLIVEFGIVALWLSYFVVAFILAYKGKVSAPPKNPGEVLAHDVQVPEDKDGPRIM